MQIGTRTTGGLVKFAVTSGGTNYTSPPAVVLTGGGGTGASAQAHLDNGRVESVVVTSAGYGYIGNPTVSFQVPSQSATIASVTAGTSTATITFAASLTATTWPILSAGTTALIQNWLNSTQAVLAAATAGTGAVTLLEFGAGAGAVAYASTGPLRPVSFFRGRFNDIYGVDGSGRGFRYSFGEGEYSLQGALVSAGGAAIITAGSSQLLVGSDFVPSVVPIGINKPAIGPTVTAASTAGGKYVSAIQMVRGGAGYHGLPTVTLSGGTPSRQATARAVVANGRVERIVVSDPGSAYQGTPTVAVVGGVGAGATFNVGMIGGVAGMRVVAAGTGYTSSGSYAATVTFSTGQGLTGASARVVVNSVGQIVGLVVAENGTGATTTGVTATINSLSGSSAAVAVDMRFGLASLTVGNSGDGYFTPPIVTIRRNVADTETADATAEASVADGRVTAATVISKGEYSHFPTVYVADSEARAQATMRDPLRGVYYCCIRYFDDTPAEENGPVYSSISELVEVDCGDGSSNLTWKFSHYGLDARVAGMELWRTTPDQRTILFRVGIIKRTDAAWSGTYVESITDIDLADTSRQHYGLMPVTLPSGQINARRFAVPPGEFAVATMFQDRAWYAVDALGLRPNTLYFSEIDEPESVSADNELIVQENSSTPDKVVALAPLGPMLLVIQQSHTYKLMYVSQPIIDASITLVAYRGVLNSRCWTVIGGVLFAADSHGVYAFDGQKDEAVSAAIDDKWRDGSIDFSKADTFHVSSDWLTKTVRFHYCATGDALPVRAYCYCVATKAWWEETYPVAVTASNLSLIGNRWMQVSATAAGGLLKSGGLSDSGTAVPYAFRTGPLVLGPEDAGALSVVYKPTAGTAKLQIGLHYNNSDSPRVNAVRTDVGAGFVSDQGGTFAELDMKLTRSALGDANGVARAAFGGRRNERSAGSDKHVAVAMAGTQASDAIVIHGVLVEGVQGAE